MNDEIEEILVPCDICGEPAIRYLKAFVAICGNPVCYVARLEGVDEIMKALNKSLESSK